ncbi:hypothetical protein DM01DRAFT_1407521 [Hesseltinella vesiculosa]|uniref:Uncharacterized protein n=1 Tax=Hesseltinella vesiculosa TaxID=101127 RepID=A0A1X2GHL5_9FUNG|nr:hypothetical protein DM01DRAFT_1407521 [Hesseltinella vesiculosa]
MKVGRQLFHRCFDDGLPLSTLQRIHANLDPPIPTSSDDRSSPFELIGDPQDPVCSRDLDSPSASDLPRRVYPDTCGCNGLARTNQAIINQETIKSKPRRTSDPVTLLGGKQIPNVQTNSDVGPGTDSSGDDSDYDGNDW